MTLEVDDELSNTSRMHIHVHASRANPNKKKKGQHQGDGGDQSRYNVRTSLQHRNQQQVHPNAKHHSPDMSFQNKGKASQGWHSQPRNPKEQPSSTNKYDSDDDARQYPQ